MANHPQTTTEQGQRSITVRGFIVRRPDGKWYAHCIDLTIDALAETPEEAIDKMTSASIAYLNWAVERDMPLVRRSPLRFQLRYDAIAMLERLRSVIRRPPTRNNHHPSLLSGSVSMLWTAEAEPDSEPTSTYTRSYACVRNTTQA